MPLRLRLALWLAAALCGMPGILLAAEASRHLPDQSREAQSLPGIPAPNWDRELAMQTAAMGADESRLQHWFSLARGGLRDPLLSAIREFGQTASLSSPVREYALWRFVQGLADFPPALLPEEVLEYLATRPLQTWVSHEESADTAVPLFNIPAAVKGLRNSADAQVAESRAIQTLAGISAHTGGVKAGQWIEAYIAGTEPERRGYLNALTDITMEQAEQLGAAAQGRMAENAALVAVAGRSALANQDREALEQILHTGRGPEVARILRASRMSLSRPDQVLLLLDCMQSAPAENAALAIALLAPDLQDNQDVTASLFDLLEDPALGSSAALALAQYPDPAVRQSLKEIAAREGPASARARLAMALYAEMPAEISTPGSPE